MIWVRSRDGLYRNKLKKEDRSQCIPVKFDRVCGAKKYAARSVFCSVALLFSRLVHCRRRVLELANNVTSLNNS